MWGQQQQQLKYSNTLNTQNQPMQPVLQHSNTINPMQQQYQPQMPMQPINTGFRLLAKGKGIDPYKYDAIVKSAQNAYNSKVNPLSQGVINGIKAMIGGEWFVLACPVGINNYDFCLSVVTGNDYLSFYIDNIHFQVCRIKN